MKKPIRLTLAGAAISLALGCAPISVSHYQTAKPIGQGNVQIGGGVHIPAAGDYGLDRDQNKGDGVKFHHGESLLLTNVDGEIHYGLTNRAEVSLKLFFTGAEAGGRYTFLDTPQLKSSFGAYAMYYTGNVEVTGGTPPNDFRDTEDIRGTRLDFPLTVSAHFGDHFAVYGGPTLSRFDATAQYSEKQNGVTTRFHRSGDFWLPGGFVGLCIGKTVQLSPGVMFYAENNVYPIPQVGGNRFYAFPFVGLSFVTDHAAP